MLTWLTYVRYWITYFQIFTRKLSISITIHDATKRGLSVWQKPKDFFHQILSFLGKGYNKRLRGQTINKAVTNWNHTEPKRIKTVIWNGTLNNFQCYPSIRTGCHGINSMTLIRDDGMYSVSPLNWISTLDTSSLGPYNYDTRFDTFFPKKMFEFSKLYTKFLVPKQSCFFPLFFQPSYAIQHTENSYVFFNFRLYDDMNSVSPLNWIGTLDTSSLGPYNYDTRFDTFSPKNVWILKIVHKISCTEAIVLFFFLNKPMQYNILRIPMSSLISGYKLFCFCFCLFVCFFFFHF